ncbi:allantoicase [Halarcobacter ebronensis]|uniref:Probable allantoicase n=1 Tax=Halarcobacter ebronensis TaxID=1462615 RepID=A0A4Q0YI21_9BACT|nr:allantoicase [Halarcobacter ebronensis]RXJ68481.1 allantoicase [Halarcobacter ebronensis]
MINVASCELGTEVIYTTDEFFANANRMFAETEAVFKDEYDDNGHWMDGWETKRRRDNSNDYCIVKLGNLSKINSFLVDTAHFKGNYPLAISVKGVCAKDIDDSTFIKDIESIPWIDLLKQSDLKGDSKHNFDSICQKEITHLRIDIYPDGGIARFKAFGEICFDENLYEQENINVASMRNGARAVYTNNEFFGPLRNILKDNEAVNMGDGWETRRRREPGFDWGIIELAKPAIIEKIVVDTKFFKGNYADSFSICSSYMKDSTDDSIITQSMFWEELISQQKLDMDKEHYFEKDILKHNKPITHIRINIFPDGGISRLKLFGKFVKED